MLFDLGFRNMSFDPSCWSQTFFSGLSLAMLARVACFLHTCALARSWSALDHARRSSAHGPASTLPERACKIDAFPGLRLAVEVFGVWGWIPEDSNACALRVRASNKIVCSLACTARLTQTSSRRRQRASTQTFYPPRASMVSASLDFCAGGWNALSSGSLQLRRQP